LTALALYNEIDPKAAAWLRELIRQGHIAPGDVSETSIEDLNPDDLRRYTQVHFFAGIGVWSYALRRAGWPDSRPVWTGSCPCQPFSAAGKGGGFDDERHLWPHFHWLISQCRPDVVFGEQVASKDGLAWIDLVQADLEGTGYANGAVDFCSAGVGAPHIRQRLYWFGERLADADGRDTEQFARKRAGPDETDSWRASGGAAGRGYAGWLDDDDTRLEGQRSGHQAQSGRIGTVRPAAETSEFSRLGDARGDGARQYSRELPGDESQHEIRPASGDHASDNSSTVGGVADADHHEQRAGRNLGSAQGEGLRPGSGERGDVVRMDDTGSERCGTRRHGYNSGNDRQQQLDTNGRNDRPGPTNGFWRAADWLHCRDAKWRPVEPGTFPLAHGAAARVGRLRGYGNAVNAEAATIFIESYLETKALTVDADGRDFRLTAEYDLTTDNANQQDIFS
jgi:DNA (cytosine-5)-methyltransferase 1